MATGCPSCGCTAPGGDATHAILRALRVDDVDAALSLGLLDARPCAACSDACGTAVFEARDARRFALAARERHRARDARLQRRKAEREVARRPLPASVATQAPALPSAAADALARALAKARERTAR